MTRKQARYIISRSTKLRNTNGPHRLIPVAVIFHALDVLRGKQKARKP